MMKRLFVGGLSSGINEKDIRERFKTFGSVSSVEVHRRQKSEGFPEKTFAYVDIDTSDSNIQRCITTLSNTKWKGGILKIQLAKESFLSRLQKEREELKSKVDNKESKPSQLPSELTSAAPNSLPGTLIPGKKDWVVGKFGRVLPIVHMRQTGSRKISRIDPSKTVHNVRRIKDDGEERPVSELTWSLERANGENVFINGNKHEEEGDDSDSSTSEETIIAPAINKKKSNPRRNEIENVDETEKMELWEGKSKMKDSSLKKYLSKKFSGHEDGLKSHEVNEGFMTTDDNDNVIKDTSFGHIDVADKNIKSLAQAKSSKKKTKKKRKMSDSSDSGQEDSIPHALLADESAVLEQRKSKSMKEHRITSLDENPFQRTENKSMSLDSKTDLKIAQNDFEMQDVENVLTLDDKIDEKKRDKRKERKRKKKSKDDMLPDSETTTNELQFSNKKMREKENNEGEKIAESGGKNNEKRKKQLVKKEENQAKKVTSNERRLQAAQEREASLLSKQSVIASALKNLDNNEKVKKVNHIKFDNEFEEEEQVIGGKEEKTKGKISGPQASNWLGLDSASDDDDAFPDKEGGEEHLLATKPQFEGETGHKLFQLQKSYKGDSRFQLDERFAESDGESAPESENDTKRHFRGDTVHSSDSHVKVSNDDDDDISKQLSREKDLSMSVLRGILGHNVFADNSSTNDKFTDSTMIHYDPTRNDHAQFENKPKKQDSPVPVVKETASQQEATKVMRSVPGVTREKFFDVKTNVLTEMFGKNKSDDSTTGFKFLSDQAPANDTGTSGPNWGAPEELRSKPWNPVMLPYDSSGDEEEQNMESEDEEQHVQTALEERFFFHFGDPDLEGCVGDEDSLFMRTKSLDELHQYWITTRSELTQDYKKKHKDAVKRQRKMAAKRARTR